MTSYVNRLTEEDVKAIADLCFSNRERVERIYLPKGENDRYIIAASIFGNEFMIQDFKVSNSKGYFTKENHDDLFLSFMYQKFGTDYLKDFADDKCHVRYCEIQLKKAQEVTNLAKERAAAEMQRILSLIGQSSEEQEVAV